MRTSLFALLVAGYLSASPSVGTLAVSPASIPVNTTTSVTTTITITDPALIAGSVNLLQVESNGKSPSILGVMHDDRLNGDAVAGDGIFTLQVSLNQAASGVVYLEVSAAFKGALQTVFSGMIPLNIR